LHEIKLRIILGSDVVLKTGHFLKSWSWALDVTFLRIWKIAS